MLKPTLSYRLFLIMLWNIQFEQLMTRLHLKRFESLSVDYFQGCWNQIKIVGEGRWQGDPIKKQEMFQWRRGKFEIFVIYSKLLWDASDTGLTLFGIWKNLNHD